MWNVSGSRDPNGLQWDKEVQGRLDIQNSIYHLISSIKAWYGWIYSGASVDDQTKNDSCDQTLGSDICSFLKKKQTIASLCMTVLIGRRSKKKKKNQFPDQLPLLDNNRLGTSFINTLTTGNYIAAWHKSVERRRAASWGGVGSELTG